MNHEVRNYPAIICLESAAAIWTRLKALQTDDSLASEFILTRAPGNPADLVVLCRRLVPALVVVGEEQFQQLPMNSLRELMGPRGIRVLVLSEKRNYTDLESFFRQGCAGALSIQVPDQTLLKALRSLLGGELWYPRALVSKIAWESFPLKPSAILTPRESEILRLVSDGITNQEIADRCFISRETVRWHIRSIYNKIGADGREAAVRQAKHLLPGDGLSSNGS